MTPSLNNALAFFEETAHGVNSMDPDVYGRWGDAQNVGPLFSLTGRADEEMAAKNKAIEDVGGYLTPDSQAFLDATKQGYINSLMDNVKSEQGLLEKRKENTIWNWLNNITGYTFFDKMPKAYEHTGIEPEEFALKHFEERYYPFWNNQTYLEKPPLKSKNYLSSYYPFAFNWDHQTKWRGPLSDEEIKTFPTYSEWLEKEG